MSTSREFASDVLKPLNQLAVHSRFLENGMITKNDISNNIWPGVSIILPILNEERFLEKTITAINEQNYPGKIEIILALGPSKDRTNEIANSLAQIYSNLKLVVNPTGRTPNGLNLAISSSQYSIICRVDGHAEVKNNYLALAVQTLLETGSVNVGGVMAANGISKFEKSVAKAMRSKIGVGAARFHVGGKAGEVDTVYLGTFDKAALLAVGGYDENFTRAQDWELNFRLRKNGGKIFFNPNLEVTYRPRPNLTALSNQYFEYGKWRHVVVRTHKGSVNFRYLAPPTMFSINLISIVISAWVPQLLIFPTLYLAALIITGLLIGRNIWEWVSLPVIFFVMHMSWGLGYLTSSPRLLGKTQKLLNHTS